MRRSEKVPAEPAREEPRCAHCDLPAGRTPDREDLGPLDAPEAHAARQEGRVPDPAVLAASPGELSHSGCVHALRAFRPDGVRPLAPGGFPRPPGGLTVHVFESHLHLPGELDQRAKTRCGVEVEVTRRVEWTVARDDAPNMCPGCKVERDRYTRAFPALLPDGPRPVRGSADG